MAAALILAVLLSPVVGEAVNVKVNPIEKVIELLSGLEAKIVDEAAAAKKLHAESDEFCEDRSANLAYEIKTAKGATAELAAAIGKETSRISSLEEQIASLIADIAKDHGDLDSATGIRGKEAADFAAEEKELMDTIDTLERAIRILEKHASMVQIKNAGSVAQALAVLVQASALSSVDAKHLTALVQSGQESDDADVGAPAAEVYEAHSGDIVDTLQGLLEKANDQLASSRKTETTNIHNFEMVQQSLQDSIKTAEKDMAKAKKGVADSSAAKAAAEGDLAQQEKQLSTDSGALEDLKGDCAIKDQNYEAESKSQAEELKAVRDAKKVISDSTSAAEDQTYDLAQISFLQRAGSSNAVKAVHFMRDLAQRQHSTALAQLAVRMASALRSQMRAGEDPFAKVKDLITGLIDKLESAADADASHKAYCDKELAETKVKQADKTAEINKLSTQIDGMAARSMQLKQELAAVEKALADIARAQAEMNKLRGEEKDAYVKGKADLEQGIEGVRTALKILRDYYGRDDKAHAAAEGAGQGIVGLLEVVESDFAQGLAEMTATEDAAVPAYEKETKENEIETAAKQQDVKFKKEEATNLDSAQAEASSDREGVQTELDAVLEYLAGLEKQCIAKAETFAERKGRFEAELAGLKEALQILNGEAVLLQTGQAAKRALRVVRHHAI